MVVVGGNNGVGQILKGKERRMMREGSKSGQKVRQTRATWECARLVKEERASVTAHAALLTTPGVVPPRRKAECLGGECSRTRHFPLSPRLLSSLGDDRNRSL